MASSISLAYLKKEYKNNFIDPTNGMTVETLNRTFTNLSNGTLGFENEDFKET